MIINERWVQPLFRLKLNNEQPADVIDDGETQVIIAGFGRFGQIVNRSLNLSGYTTTVLEHDAAQIEYLRKFGHKVFYGDASRQELLHAAGAGNARLLVIAIDDHNKAKDIVQLCQKHYPHLKLFARARGRIQAHEFNKMGVEVFVRDTFHSALFLSEQVMTELGAHPYMAHRAIRTFKKFDEQHVRDLIKVERDTKDYVSVVQKNKAELEQVLRADISDKDQFVDDHWGKHS